MRKINLVKITIAAAVLIIGLGGFLLTRKSEMQTLKPFKTPEKILEVQDEVAGYKNWTKVNDKPQIMWSETLALCRAPNTRDMENDTHKNKYINVYVNEIGKAEMLTKKNPAFPIGTVVVKEKISPYGSKPLEVEKKAPELLTVMIKREKGFNPEVGDWEFITLNGTATEVTSRGKLESCQRCHVNYEQNNFVTRTYLPEDIRQKLK
jgi:hypothetical protein